MTSVSVHGAKSADGSRLPPGLEPRRRDRAAAPRRQRVLLIQTQAENAGAQEISRLLSAGLAARGYETTQLFFFRRTSSFDDVPGARFCATKRPTGPISLLRFLFRLVACIRQAKPDAVLTFQHYGNLIGAAAARLAGARHVIASQTTAAALLHPLVRRLDRAFGRMGVYDAIVVNSNATESEHANYPTAYRSRIISIPHGFESKTSTLAKPAARRALGLPHDAVMLGCAARLHPLKNLDAIVRVLPRRPPWHLALAGQGADRGRLEALAATLECADRVHFLGELPTSEIGTFLASLDIFVFPSVAETFGLAVVEAAQAGVPVVANRLPVLEEVLQVDGEPCALFTHAADPDALTASIDRMLSDGDLAATISDRAARLAGVYSLDDMIESYASAIDVIADPLMPSDQPSRP